MLGKKEKMKTIDSDGKSVEIPCWISQQEFEAFSREWEKLTSEILNFLKKNKIDIPLTCIDGRGKIYITGGTKC